MQMPDFLCMAAAYHDVLFDEFTVIKKICHFYFKFNTP